MPSKKYRYSLYVLALFLLLGCNPFGCLQEKAQQAAEKAQQIKQATQQAQDLVEQAKRAAEGSSSANGEQDGSVIKLVASDLRPYRSGVTTLQVLATSTNEKKAGTFFETRRLSEDGTVGVTTTYGESVHQHWAKGNQFLTINKKGECTKLESEDDGLVAAAGTVSVGSYQIMMLNLLTQGVIQENLTRVGTDEVSGKKTTHYRFDNSKGVALLAKVSMKGEVWLDDNGEPLRSNGNFTLQAGSDGLGYGWTFEASKLGEPVSVEVAKQCEELAAGTDLLSQLPKLPDAKLVPMHNATTMMYSSKTGLVEASAFYKNELKKMGFKLIEEKTAVSTLLRFEREEEALNVILSSQNDSEVSVVVTLK